MAWYLTAAKTSSCLAKAHAKRVEAEPWIVFWKNLANEMLENNLNDNGVEEEPVQVTIWSSINGILVEHKFKMWPVFCSKWMGT